MARSPNGSPAPRTNTADHLLGDSARFETAGESYTRLVAVTNTGRYTSRPAAPGRPLCNEDLRSDTPPRASATGSSSTRPARRSAACATQLADALRGKRKPEYTPHIDVGDFVIVVNAERIGVTGKKRQEKRYYRHSGYPGGLRSRTLEEMLDRRPEEVIRLAVKGMLPRTRLGRAQLRKLKVYAGPDHPHAAQKPEPLEVET